MDITATKVPGSLYLGDDGYFVQNVNVYAEGICTHVEKKKYGVPINGKPTPLVEVK